MKAITRKVRKARRGRAEQPAAARIREFPTRSQDVYGLVTAPAPKAEARKAHYFMRHDLLLGMIGTVLGFLAAVSFPLFYHWLENCWAVLGPILCVLAVLAASPLIIGKTRNTRAAPDIHSHGHGFYFVGLGFLGPQLGIFSMALLYFIQHISS